MVYWQDYKIKRNIILKNVKLYNNFTIILLYSVAQNHLVMVTLTLNILFALYSVYTQQLKFKKMNLCLLQCLCYNI